MRDPSEGLGEDLPSAPTDDEDATVIKITRPDGSKAFYPNPVMGSKVVQDAHAQGSLKSGDRFILIGLEYPDIWVKDENLNAFLPDGIAMDLVALRGQKGSTTNPYVHRNT